MRQEAVEALVVRNERVGVPPHGGGAHKLDKLGEVELGFVIVGAFGVLHRPEDETQGLCRDVRPRLEQLRLLEHHLHLADVHRGGVELPLEAHVFDGVLVVQLAHVRAVPHHHFAHLRERELLPQVVALAQHRVRQHVVLEHLVEPRFGRPGLVEAPDRDADQSFSKLRGCELLIGVVDERGGGAFVAIFRFVCHHKDEVQLCGRKVFVEDAAVFRKLLEF
mmetsp:Transcript_29735/g.96903  ORF Transcript_29735/g.96903 Transcript_29735/m.96903 type:complete len:221 (-) Transcript_29735:2192-2854(-)